MAGVLAVAYLAWTPFSLDLAAAEYRAGLFTREGFSLWDMQWYAGHHLPGYSVVVPALSSWLGPRLLGALAIVVVTILFERLAWVRYGAQARLGVFWFALGSVTMLLSGRIAFAVGTVPALGALVALQAAGRARTRRAKTVGTTLALVLGAVTALTSPVAALFVALSAIALAVGERRLGPLALAVAALGPIVALAIMFPEGGEEPFPVKRLIDVLEFAIIAELLVARTERTLRVAIALYMLASLLAFLLPTPVGVNVVRLGALCAGPILALAVSPSRRWWLAFLAVPLLWWQWADAVVDVRDATTSPTVHESYYRPLLAALDRAQGSDTSHSGVGGRLEIPFTRLHWEARWVAPRYPLARGWERQMDIASNGVFYRGTLTPARYRAWLALTAVRWVALPATRLDYSATSEARLINQGLPFLHQIWHDSNWRLFEVRDPTSLVRGPARVTATTADTVSLQARRRGPLLLRVRWTPYWAVSAGDACVEPDGAWTRVVVRQPGAIRLSTRFALDRVAARSPRCS